MSTTAPPRLAVAPAVFLDKITIVCGPPKSGKKTLVRRIVRLLTQSRSVAGAVVAAFSPKPLTNAQLVRMVRQDQERLAELAGTARNPAVISRLLGRIPAPERARYIAEGRFPVGALRDCPDLSEEERVCLDNQGLNPRLCLVLDRATIGGLDPQENTSRRLFGEDRCEFISVVVHTQKLRHLPEPLRRHADNIIFTDIRACRGFPECDGLPGGVFAGYQKLFMDCTGGGGLSTTHPDDYPEESAAAATSPAAAAMAAAAMAAGAGADDALPPTPRVEELPAE